VHLGYLLGAQVTVGAWNDAETTMRQIVTMIGDVNSTRMVVLLTGILPELKHEHRPESARETAEQLRSLLSQITVFSNIHSTTTNSHPETPSGLR
jgi:hypothetical protein